MMQCSRYFIIFVCVSIFAAATVARAEEEIEDLIDVFDSPRRIIAVVQGRRAITEDLQPKEFIRWKGSKGYLGACLTNSHFYVISTTSGAWQALPLRLKEEGKGDASISEFIAMLVLGDRAVAFNAAANQFIEAQLPIHDALITTGIDRSVAVVITSSRLFGFASKASSFNDISLRVQETVEDLKLTAGKATVRTSDRILTFDADNASWNEYQFQ